MTPLNIFSKKLVLFAVLLSVVAALVSAGCDTGSPSNATATPVTNMTTGNAPSATSVTGASSVPPAVATESGGSSTSPGGNGTGVPGGVGTSVPAVVNTPPAQLT